MRWKPISVYQWESTHTATVYPVNKNSVYFIGFLGVTDIGAVGETNNKQGLHQRPALLNVC
ncbi:MAG: hypothetical protein HFG16_06315 [Erysipelotrichaceae bacterium]|nr:hypothetical protein [Erysipelotrichaceae bacterium]